MNMKDTYFIFDLDGTLADTLPDIISSVNTMLERMQLPPREAEEIKRSIGSGIHQVVKNLTNIQESRLIDQAVSYFRESYEKHFLDKTQLYDGAKEFVSNPSFKGSVISNKPESFVKKILESLKIGKYFDICIGGLADFPHKPDTASTHHVIRTFASKKSPFFVGDSIIDQNTARLAAVPFCFARYGYEDYNENLFQPDHSISNFKELLTLFS